VEDKAEIQYELDLNDIKSYLDYTWNNSKKQRRMRKIIRIFFVSVGVLFIIAAIVLPLIGQLSASIAIILGLVGLYSIFFGIFWIEFWKRTIYKQTIKMYNRKPNTMIGKHQLSITSEGITDINDIAQSNMHWGGISWYANNDQYLFFSGYVNNVYIIPRRAFVDETSFNQFVETAKSYYQKTILKK
jgi:hypothetical protein